MPQALTEAIVLDAARVIAALLDTPLALAIDEAIENRDRNIGNVLWDGAQATWIDHERSLGLAPNMADRNMLAEISIVGGSVITIQRAAVEAAMQLTHQVLPVLCATGVCSGVYETESHSNFVTDRLADLAMRVLKTFSAAGG